MTIASRLVLVPAFLLAAALPARGDEWGTLKGRFVLGGDAADPTALTVDKR
jgi:hypothetical protein